MAQKQSQKGVLLCTRGDCKELQGEDEFCKRHQDGKNRYFTQEEFGIIFDALDYHAIGIYEGMETPREKKTLLAKIERLEAKIETL